MTPAFTYAIKFVADMDASVAFHAKVLGLELRFASPEWSEFNTGATTLALHLASERNPPGTAEVGYRVPDVDAFCAELAKQGVPVIQPPEDLHGIRLAKLRDVDGSEFSVSGPQ